MKKINKKMVIKLLSKIFNKMKCNDNQKNKVKVYKKYNRKV